MAHPVVWAGPGEDGRPIRSSGRPTWRSVRVWEAEWDRRGREAFSEVRERSGGPSTGLGEVERPTWRSRWGREALPEVQKAHPEVWVGLERPPRG